MIYHGDGGLLDLRKECARTTKTLRALLEKRAFDCLVVRGNSGALVGAVVSLRLNVPLIVVRKDSAHSATPINIQNIGKKPLFLDDFIAGGGTKNACRDAITPKHLVGQFEYRDQEYHKLDKHGRCV